jgi:tetratricopeptide (TPR) repeat protein
MRILRRISDFRFPISILLFVLPCLLAQAHAEEPPHLDFVHGLEARGMPDLALQYLEELAKKPPAGLVPLLPLELGKARLALAALTPDSGQRGELQRRAQTDLAQFIKKSGNLPQAADAAVALARISMLEGKTLASQARHEQDKRRKVGQMIRARFQFEEAGLRLETALARIDAQIKGDSALSAEERRTLVQARLQASLERGINFLDGAETYVADSEFAMRGDLLKKAMDTLERLSKEDAKNPLCWDALAWLGRCHIENDDPKTARKVLAEVIAGSPDLRENAKRLARYFLMLALARDTENKNPFAKVQQAGEEWLRLYPNYRDTLEGIAVRARLADACFEQAQRAAKNPPRARELYERARKLYQELEQPPNEYSDLAHKQKGRIVVILFQDRTRGDITKLKDFEECYLRAQVEIERLNEEATSRAGNKLEEKRRAHFKDMVQSLNRALDLADEKTQALDLNEARFLLAYAYLESGDYYAAAVVGEDLARTAPQFARSALAGVYALQAYAQLLAKQQAAGASSEDLAVDRARLEHLARIIQTQWPTSGEADSARHMLGALYLGSKRYADAVEVLEGIGSGYADATRALYQLGLAAWRAHLDKVKAAPEKAAFADRAVAALARISPPADGSGMAELRDYFAAKRLLADIYYATRQFDRMQTLAEALLKRLDRLDDNTKAEEQTNILATALYAKLGKAESLYESGQYAQARSLLEPLVSQLKNPAESRAHAGLKDQDPGLWRALLGLALRANVQEGKTERAQEILDLLQKSFPENSLDILIQFVAQLRTQMAKLHQQGPAAKPRVDQTVASFSAFLDQLAKQQGIAARPEVILFLAQSYSSLDKHDRAAELAGKIPEPQPAPGMKDPDPKQVQVYHSGQLLRARELRLNQDFPKAETELKAIQQTKWGQQSLDARKEAIFLLEDQGKYTDPAGGAIRAWTDLMKMMKPRLQDNKVKEQYFDCYYHLTYCLYKHALKIHDPQRRKNWVRVAANYILRLEEQQDAATDACKKNLEELLDREPLLREEYEQVKKSTAANGG